MQQKLVFDEATHRPSEVKTLKSTSPSTVGDVFYSYDAAGNVRKAADTPADGTASTQCFGYDDLQRLNQAWTPSSGDCGTAPSVVGLGGAAPYWKSWTFDGTGVAATTGNRKTETTHTTGGDRTVTSAYELAGHAHAVSGTTTTLDGKQTGTAGYGYDEVGNTTSQPGPTAQQTLRWDGENDLSSVTEGSGTTTYIYGADGSRLVARDSSGTTIYLGGTVLRLSSTGVTTAERYYTYNGQVVAQRTAAGLQFLTGDPHGTSTIAVANTTTQAVTKRYQDPYGNGIGSAVQWVGQKSFVGGDQDPTGLVHLGAREYDPATGRFVSVDPVQDLADPQQWNGYAYANNNPTTLSDPGGLVPHDPDLDDQFGHEKPGTGKYKTRTAGGGGGRGKGGGHQKGGVTVVETMGVDKQKIAHVCITDVLCLDQYQVTNIQAYINAYNAQIASLSRGNGGQTLAEYQYLMAIVNACGNGIKVSENCSMESYLMLNNGAAEASKQAYEDAHGTPAWKDGVTAVGMIGEAISGLPACQIRAFAAGGRRSFSGDTPVLMADGTQKKFKDLKEGDEVQATDPETGEQAIRKVQAVWVHADDLYTLTVNGKPLTTTEDHPFWDETDARWERADELDKGDLPRTPTGTRARVDGFRLTTHHVAPAYNLTVDDLHTYYVLAGNFPVLVHNEGCGQSSYYRGARDGGPTFVPRPNDYKVDAATGFVKETHGVSLFDNPESITSKGFEPHGIDMETVPSTLRVIQRGRDMNHYEIVPASGANLTPFEVCRGTVEKFDACAVGVGNLAKSYDVSFPEYLDGYEAETEAKGYLVGVAVIVDDRTFDLTIYDRARLVQELDDELGSDRAYFAVPNLLVVPSVTRAEISRAVEVLAKGQFQELVPNVTK